MSCTSANAHYEKHLTQAKHFDQCVLHAKVLKVLERKPKSKTAFMAAIADTLHSCLSPYGMAFGSDRTSVYMNFTYSDSTTRRSIIDAKAHYVDLSYYHEDASAQDRASLLCYSIAVALDYELFRTLQTFEPVKRADFGWSCFPAFAKAQRRAWEYAVDAAQKLYVLEPMLPVLPFVSEGVKSILEKPGICDLVDLGRLTASLTSKDVGYYNAYRLSDFTAQCSARGDHAAFKVTDSLQAAWLAVDSWSERVALRAHLERLSARWTLESLLELHISFTASLPLGSINPPKDAEDRPRQQAQARVLSDVSRIEYNAEQPLEAILNFAQKIAGGDS